MAKEREKKAICLVRVSTEMQHLESQAEKVVAAAKADGYADPIIIQNKESAVKKSESELLGINEMKQYIESGDIDVVYTSEISRLSRRPKVLYSIRDYLVEHGVQLICLNPYFKLLTSDGQLDQMANIVLGLFSTMAENEGMLRTERCKRGKAKKKAEGRFIGGKVLEGYKRDENDFFVVDPEGAEVVRRVYGLFVGGMNRLEITRVLRAEGYMQNFMSDVAAHSHVDNMLRNEDYTGKNGKPQIISQNLFDRAQEILDVPRMKRHKVKCTALCRGIMVNTKSISHRKQYYVRGYEGSYFCLLDKTEEHKKFVRIADVDPVVWREVKRVYKEQQDGRNRDKEKRIQKQREANITRRIAHLESQVNSNQAKREICEERLIMQRISEAKAQEMLDKIDAMEQQQKQEIEELRKELEELQSNGHKIIDIESLNGDQREELVARLVHHIDLVPLSEAKCMSKYRISIYFKRGDAFFGYVTSGRQAREDVKK